MPPGEMQLNLSPGGVFDFDFQMILSSDFVRTLQDKCTGLIL